MKALEFIRVSGLNQDNERQRCIIEDYANKNNIDLVHLPNAINNKISGLKGLKKRPDLIGLIQYLEDNQDVKLVIASELSRIGRTIEVILIIETLAKMGVNLYVIKESINTLDDNGKISADTEFRINILSSVAKYEADMIRYRMLTGKKVKVSQNNQFGGGSPSFGYDVIDKHYVINDLEAQEVVNIFEMFANGKGTNTIARYMNTTNFLTRKNKPFTPKSIRDILRNPIYIGKAKYGEFEIQTPPIISPDLFEKAQEFYKHTKKGTHTVNQYLIETKLIKCAICGKSYYPTINKKSKINKYCCYSKKLNAVNKADCGNNSININKLNNVVLYDILYNSNTRQLIESELQKNGFESKIEQLKKELYLIQKKIKFIENKESDLLEAYLNKVISLTDLNSKKIKLIDEKNQYTSDIAAKQNMINQLNKLKKNKKTLLELFSNKENKDKIKENINNIIQRIEIKAVKGYVNETNKLDALTKVSIFTINNQYNEYLVTRYSDIIFELKKEVDVIENLSYVAKFYQLKRGKLNKNQLNKLIDDKILKVIYLSEYFKKRD